MHLIVTRPLAQAKPWLDALGAAGWQAHALPLIEIEALADKTELLHFWRGIAGFKLLMFVSANAVSHFFAARPQDLLWPSSTWAGSTGPGTSAALLACGVPQAQVIEPDADALQWDSEALWRQLQRRLSDWDRQRACIVRGEDGRDWLAEQLGARGAELQFLTAYRRVAPQLDPLQKALVAQALVQPHEYLWLFSSSEALANLSAAWPGQDWAPSQALASHPRIAQTASELGFGQVSLVRGGPAQVLDWLQQARPKATASGVARVSGS